MTRPKDFLCDGFSIHEIKIAVVTRKSSAVIDMWPGQKKRGKNTSEKQFKKYEARGRT